MSTAIALPPVLAPAADMARLRGMTTSDLRAELGRALGLSAENIVWLAAIWRELEGRGEDLSDLRSGLGAFLPLIASGRLAAEAVVAFASQRNLLHALLALPIEEQRSLAAGASVRTLEIDADGVYGEIDVPATRLSAAQVRLVFDRGRIRRPAEQMRMLRAVPGRRISGHRREKISVEPGTGRLRIGGVSFAPMEIIAALHRLFRVRLDDGARTETLTVPMTSTERIALERHAQQAGVAVDLMVRQVLQATGVTTFGATAVPRRPGPRAERKQMVMAKIRETAGRPTSMEELIRLTEASEPTLYAYVRELRREGVDIKFRRPGAAAKPKRNAEVVQAIESGESLRDIAKRLGLTHQRIYQIAQSAGATSVRSPIFAAAAKAERAVAKQEKIKEWQDRAAQLRKRVESGESIAAAATALGLSRGQASVLSKKLKLGSVTKHGRWRNSRG